MECGKIMLQLVFIGMCVSVCSNSFLKHWHSYIPSVQAIPLRAWHELLHTLHISLLTRHVILHSRYIYPYATHQHIYYTPGIHTHTHTHTHTHNLVNYNPIYTITHRNIHKQTHGIYTYTHDKYTTSCRYTYTRNIYTFALSIDNYTPGNYKYRLGTYNMIIYTTA